MREVSIKDALNRRVLTSLSLIWISVSLIGAAYLYFETKASIDRFVDLVAKQSELIIKDGVLEQDHFTIQRELSRFLAATVVEKGYGVSVRVKLDGKLVAQEFSSLHALRPLLRNQISFSTISGAPAEIDVDIYYGSILVRYGAGFAVAAVLMLGFFLFFRSFIKRTILKLMDPLNAHVGQLKQLTSEIERMESPRQFPKTQFRELKILGESAEQLSNAIVRYKREASRSEAEKLAVIERTERETAIAKVARMLAHDVRQPFTVLKHALHALKKVDSVEDMQELAGSLECEMAKSLSMAEAMIGDISALGIATQLEVSEANLSDLISDAVKLCAPYPAGVTVTSEISADVSMRIDRHQFLRALMNVIMNAKQAISGDGFIKITASLQPDHVHISISNNGPKIPESSLPKLFDVDFTEQKRGGTGLGLAIVRKIILQHGGTVACTSSDEETCFSFVVPLSIGVISRETRAHSG